MGIVLQPRNPLKITGGIVVSIPINVVDLWITGWIGNESSSNKSMDYSRFGNPIDGNADAGITSSRVLGFEDFPGLSNNNSIRASYGSRGRPNSS